MKKFPQYSTLKQTYYRNFILLIVIPLIFVFIAAELIVGYIIRESAIETIDALQTNIAATVSSDVKTNSLQLSHFIYTNDGEFLQTAVQAHNAQGSKWYQADQLLQQGFNTAVVPSQNILAGGFYMKNGGAVYMKDDIIVSEDRIRESDWYQKALDKPNVITLGCYDTGKDRLISSNHRRNQMVIVTAMATNMSTDKSGEIEVVTFFTESRISDIMLPQNKRSGHEMSVILDKDGRVLFGDMGNSDMKDYFEAHLRKLDSESWSDGATLFDGTEKRYFFKSKSIPDTDWSVVTFTEERFLSQQFYPTGGLLLLIVAILLILFYLYSRHFLNTIITPIHTVCEGMSRLDESDLEVYVEPTGEREIRDLITSFNEMVLGIKNMFRVTEETTQKKHEAEIQALQRQINPHFIVNTLNSIRFMAEVAKFDGIRKMAEALVAIVSCSFRSNVNFYTVKDELEMLKTYVYLMRIRYSNGFEVSYEIDGDCYDYQIPRLTLQPIVENSITHGFSELTDELGQIKISVFEKDEFLCLEVWDNGRGISAEQIKSLLEGNIKRSGGSSIGIENVQARLRLHFGEAAHIDMKSELGKYTETTLKLPLATCKKGGRND